MTVVIIKRTNPPCEPTLWCFNIVGREILTLGEGFNTQVITLWCFNIVGRERF